MAKGAEPSLSAILTGIVDRRPAPFSSKIHSQKNHKPSIFLALEVIV